MKRLTPNLPKFDDLKGLYDLPKNIVPIQSSSNNYLGNNLWVCRIGCFPGEPITAAQEEENHIGNQLLHCYLDGSSMLSTRTVR